MLEIAEGKCLSYFCAQVDSQPGNMKEGGGEHRGTREKKINLLTGEVPPPQVIKVLPCALLDASQPSEDAFSPPRTSHLRNLENREAQTPISPLPMYVVLFSVTSVFHRKTRSKT